MNKCGLNCVGKDTKHLNIHLQMIKVNKNIIEYIIAEQNLNSVGIELKKDDYFYKCKKEKACYYRYISV